MPRNRSIIYLDLLLLFYFAQVLMLSKSIWLGLKYNLFYVNVDHLVVAKIDVRLAMGLAILMFSEFFYKRELQNKS